MVTIDIKAVEAYIQDLFNEKIPDFLTYHDIEHTRYVVEQARIIGAKSGLSDEEMNIAITAAWFHDAGFAVSSTEHEKESQIIAKEYLSSTDIDDKFIDRVIRCIQATQMPQDPGEDLPAMVLCDADMSYLSEDFYMQRTALLREEWNHISKDKISKRTYWEMTVEMFRNHDYYTEYGKKVFTPGKEENLELILEILDKMQKKRKEERKKLKNENKTME